MNTLPVTKQEIQDLTLPHLQNPIFKILSQSADQLGYPCYVIGGYVRDIFLQRPSNDIDVVVVGSGIKMAEQVRTILGKKAYLSVFKNFGTAQISYKGMEVEIVGARKESYHRESRKPIVEDGTLEDDQNRRDFTINALACCLNEAHFGEVVDPFNGLRDMEWKLLRTPLNPDITFSDDPLRMMRCIRFATQLGFSIEEETFKALIRNKERISIISEERIAEELNKIMMAPRPSIGFKLLKACGLLGIILPEVERLSGIETINGKGHKDVFLHTLQVVDNVAQKSDSLWLRWAALFHDIAKPKTKHFDPKIGWSFHNHNFIGARMVPKIFARLKFPMGDPMKFVQKMVDLHMRPIALVEEEITDSAVRRLLFEAGDDIEDLMLLCEADITSRNEEKVKKYTENLHQVHQKLKDIEQKDHIRNFQPPVMGQEIMETFHLTPCATVGEIKNRIKDAILDGIIPNEYEAAKAYMFEIAKELGLEIPTQS